MASVEKCLRYFPVREGAEVPVDAPLVFGAIHYSIMFYGGGLLRHLTPDDPEAPTFKQFWGELPRDNAEPACRLWID